MTRDHNISEGKKGRKKEKRRQEQSKEDVRTVAEKNRQRNQGERNQTNVIKKPCWARFLPGLCFRAGREVVSPVILCSSKAVRIDTQWKRRYLRWYNTWTKYSTKSWPISQTHTKALSLGNPKSQAYSVVLAQEDDSPVGWKNTALPEWLLLDIPSALEETADNLF